MSIDFPAKSTAGAFTFLFYCYFYGFCYFVYLQRGNLIEVEKKKTAAKVGTSPPQNGFPSALPFPLTPPYRRLFHKMVRLSV